MRVMRDWTAGSSRTGEGGGSPIEVEDGERSGCGQLEDPGLIVTGCGGVHTYSVRYAWTGVKLRLDRKRCHLPRLDARDGHSAIPLVFDCRNRRDFPSGFRETQMILSLPFSHRHPRSPFLFRLAFPHQCFALDDTLRHTRPLICPQAVSSNLPSHAPSDAVPQTPRADP